MRERRFVSHNGDVALPEQKIASPQLLELVRARERAAQCLLLHVTVARTRDAAGGERKLQQSRAIDVLTGDQALRISRKALARCLNPVGIALVVEHIEDAVDTMAVGSGKLLAIDRRRQRGRIRREVNGPYLRW